MGACYSVEARLRFADGDGRKFAKLMNEFIDENDGVTAFFGIKDTDPRETAYDVLKILLPYCHDWGADNNGNDYTADFDASYGWETIMIDAFESCGKGLLEGSVVLIYPDSGLDVLEFQNGEFLQTS